VSPTSRPLAPSHDSGVMAGPDEPDRGIQHNTLRLTNLFGDSPSLAHAAPVQYPERYTDYAFPVKGQGTISFSIAANGPFRIVLNNDKSQSGSDSVVVLEVGDRATTFRMHDDDGDGFAHTTSRDALVEVGTERTYWLSLDKNNWRLRFGKGEMLPNLTLFEYVIPEALQRDFGFIAELSYIALVNVPDEAVSAHCLWAIPVTSMPAPILVPSDELTVDDIASGARTVAADLPTSAQVLYGTVAGNGIALDATDFPDFAAAINHSIDTPGCICYEKLKKKDPAFGYLRVTIGPNQGDSPGSPHVVEIWPAGHSSPIHDHGNACAIIKVLHGSIKVELFPELKVGLYPFGSVVFFPGEVTYLTPQVYQIHRLTNPAKAGMTATIQSYRYPDDDIAHYEFFDYIDKDSIIEKFLPDSDWEYLPFKELIRKEWGHR
jgi:hypothetical protein